MEIDDEYIKSTRDGGDGRVPRGNKILLPECDCSEAPMSRLTSQNRKISGQTLRVVVNLSTHSVNLLNAAMAATAAPPASDDYVKQRKAKSWTKEKYISSGRKSHPFSERRNRTTRYTLKIQLTQCNRSWKNVSRRNDKSTRLNYAFMDKIKIRFKCERVHTSSRSTTNGSTPYLRIRVWYTAASSAKSYLCCGPSDAILNSQLTVLRCTVKYRRCNYFWTLCLENYHSHKFSSWAERPN